MLQRYFHCVLQYSRNILGISSLSISSKSVSCILTNVCHRIIQLITKVGTNHQPTTTTSPNHVPLCCMHSCQVSPETVTPPLPWAACANSSPLFLKKKCFLISSLNLSWHNFFFTSYITSCPVTVTWGKIPTPTSAQPPFRQL